jgi:hypothetical protein
VRSVPPSVTERINEVDHEIDAQPADEAAPAHPQEVKPKARRRRRPPTPPAPQAAEAVAPEIPVEKMPDLLNRLLRGI